MMQSIYDIFQMVVFASAGNYLLFGDYYPYNKDRFR